jgi:hypothetical protein
MWRYSLCVLHFVYSRGRHTVRLFMHIVVKCNSLIIGVTMASSYVVLKYIATASEFRNVNIRAPTSGIYSTQNIFTLTYFTQLQYYTTYPHQGYLSYIYSVLNTTTEPCGQNNIRTRAHERFFAAARSGETAAVADYFLA